MNITFEIANETIMGVAQICNESVVREITDVILVEAWKQVATWAFIKTLFATTVFALGWFGAGWWKRKAVIIKEGTKQ